MLGLHESLKITDSDFDKNVVFSIVENGDICLKRVEMRRVKCCRKKKRIKKKSPPENLEPYRMKNLNLKSLKVYCQEKNPRSI